MSKNNDQKWGNINAKINKTLKKVTQRIFENLITIHNFNEKKSEEIARLVVKSATTEMFNIYYFKNPEAYNNQRKTPLYDFYNMNIYDDFKSWIMIALSVPFYQSLGDTIGYKNGQWEFNYNEIDSSPDYVNNLLYEYISLGGVNDLDITDWLSSDDTILYMATMKVLTQPFTHVNEFGTKLREEYLKVMPLLENRHPGRVTMESLKKQQSIEWNQLPYNSQAIGNGSVMRSGCIGIFFLGRHNRNILIALAVECSRITHNSTIAILGSITSALFTAYALERKPVNHWPHKLLKILKSQRIDEYMEKSRPKEYDFFREEKGIYISQWENYVSKRFTGLRLNTNLKIMSNPVARYKYLSENFSKKCRFPGGCADDCLIMAYDAVLESGGIYEKMLIYSILHPGDSDTVGSVAFSWFGAMYGSPKIEKVVFNFFKELEYKSQLYDLVRDNIVNMIQVYYYDLCMEISLKYLKPYVDDL